MGRLSPADFHTVYGFRRPNMSPLEGSRQVCGLDYPFTLPRVLHRWFPRRALKFSLSPLRMPFRHARTRLTNCLSMMGRIAGKIRPFLVRGSDGTSGFHATSIQPSFGCRFFPCAPTVGWRFRLSPGFLSSLNVMLNEVSCSLKFGG
jgi:hypothetical protein